MTIDEVRDIKEAMSLETIGMSVSELHSYYSKGAKEIQRMVDEPCARSDAGERESPVLEKAVKKLVYVSSDELIRYEMDLQEKAELDYRSDMADQYDEGREEGLEEGREEGHKEGVDISVGILRALNSKDSENDIAERYKISIEKVRELRAELDHTSTK